MFVKLNIFISASASGLLFPSHIGRTENVLEENLFILSLTVTKRKKKKEVMCSLFFSQENNFM